MSRVDTQKTLMILKSYVSMVSALCPCLSDPEFYSSMTTDLPLPPLDDEKRTFMEGSERSRGKPRG